MRKLVLIGMVIITGCTVSIIYINRPDDVKIENDLNSRVDAKLNKKDSIGIDFSRRKNKNTDSIN